MNRTEDVIPGMLGGWSLAMVTSPSNFSQATTLDCVSEQQVGLQISCDEQNWIWCILRSYIQNGKHFIKFPNDREDSAYPTMKRTGDDDSAWAKCPSCMDGSRPDHILTCYNIILYSLIIGRTPYILQWTEQTGDDCAFACRSPEL